jgi:hypothetical protein
MEIRDPHKVNIVIIRFEPDIGNSAATEKMLYDFLFTEQSKALFSQLNRLVSEILMNGFTWRL